MDDSSQVETLSAPVAAISLPDRETERRLSPSFRQMFDSLADLCNRLPFSGKIAITPITSAAFRERNPYYMAIKTAEAIGFLGLMVMAHSVQTGMGLAKLYENLERYSLTRSPESLLACSIDVAYIAANCAATYAQLHLGHRLAEHFLRRGAKAVPRLKAWGIDGGEVDYDTFAEMLMNAIASNNQFDIDTFFMILPKEEKKRVMASIKAISEVVDETYSYEDISDRIAQLDKIVETRSRSRYILTIIKNAHRYHGIKTYSFRECMIMGIVTLGGQIIFLSSG